MRYFCKACQKMLTGSDSKIAEHFRKVHGKVPKRFRNTKLCEPKQIKRKTVGQIHLEQFNKKLKIEKMWKDLVISGASRPFTSDIGFVCRRCLSTHHKGYFISSKETQIAICRYCYKEFADSKPMPWKNIDIVPFETNRRKH